MIQLRLLGPPDIEGPDEDSISSVLSQSKRLALLAYLAAAKPHGYHRRDELVGVFWPDRDDSGARRSLRQALYFLRHALGREVIVSRGDDDVAVDHAQVRCDVVDFERALAGGDPEGALTHYRGEFLSAFHLSGVPEFERWMDAERDRLGSLAVSAAEQWARESAAAGDITRAIVAARRGSELAPASGRAARTLVELLLRSGNRAGALDAYDAFMKRLSRDYGLAPPDELRKLVEHIGAGDRDAVVEGLSDTRTPEPVTRVDRSGAPPTETRRYLGPVALGTALVAVSVLLWLSPRRPEGSEIVIERLAQVTFDGVPKLTPAVSPDGSQIAYTSTAGLGGSSASSGSLARSSGAPVVIQHVAGGRRLQITDDDGGIARYPRWSPDGSRLIYSEDGRLYSVGALGGNSRLALADSGISFPAWSPDGSALAYGLSDPFADTLFVHDQETGRTREIGPGYWPVWSHDGRWIAYVVDNSFYSRLGGGLSNASPSAIHVVAAVDGSPVTVVPNAELNVSPAWLPDGRLLFVSSRGGGRDVYVVRLNDDGTQRGEPERLTTGLDPHTISASRDGRRIVFSTLVLRRNVWAIDIPVGDVVSAYGGEQITAGSQIVEGVAVSPDGAWLAFDSNRAGNQDVYVRRISGGEVIQVTRDPADEFVSGWSPDGQWLTGHGFRNGNRDVYVVRMNGTGYEIVYDAPSQDRYPDWSPDGRSIAFSSTTGGPRSVYITTRSQGSTWSEPRLLTQGDHPRWSRDGGLITFTDQGTVGVIDAAGGERQELFVGRTGGSSSAWAGDDDLVVNDLDSDGTVIFYHVALDGSPPGPLVRFDDPLRLARTEFAVHDGRVYYSVGEFSGDLWVMDLAW